MPLPLVVVVEPRRNEQQLLSPLTTPLPLHNKQGCNHATTRSIRRSSNTTTMPRRASRGPLPSSPPLCSRPGPGTSCPPSLPPPSLPPSPPSHSIPPPLLTTHQNLTLQRPPPEQRKFRSAAVDEYLEGLFPRFKDPNLAVLFSNCCTY